MECRRVPSEKRSLTDRMHHKNRTACRCVCKLRTKSAVSGRRRRSQSAVHATPEYQTRTTNNKQSVVPPRPKHIQTSNPCLARPILFFRAIAVPTIALNAKKTMIHHIVDVTAYPVPHSNRQRKGLRADKSVSPETFGPLFTFAYWQ